MDRSQRLNEQLRRWMQAGLIDADQAGAIRRWEDSQPSDQSSSADQFALPIRLSILLGSLLLSAGLLLFVFTLGCNATRGAGELAVVDRDRSACVRCLV